MTDDKNEKPILVIEDSPEDFEVLEYAFKKVDSSLTLVHCKNASEALDFLLKRGEYDNLPASMHPSLILLDLNMPGIDGHTLLQTLKLDSRLEAIPIVVLSTSVNTKDVQKSYAGGASGYISKPNNMKSYVDMVENIKSYWFSLCTLPSTAGEQ